MAREFSRLRRIEGLISRRLAEIIHQEMADPRVGMIAVTGVVVSKDLAFAKVYFTTPGTAEEIAETARALNLAKGYLRTQLAQSCQLRATPALKFIHDTSYMRANRIHELLAQAMNSIHE